ncbi:hypothetical protein AOLI_G00281230 [Acnodon oligacanthus]
MNLFCFCVFLVFFIIVIIYDSVSQSNNFIRRGFSTKDRFVMHIFIIIFLPHGVCQKKKTKQTKKNTQTDRLTRSVIVNVVALRLFSASPFVHFIPLPLLYLLHLLGVAAESSAELAPGFERYRNGVPVAGFDLAHPQKHSVLVGAHVEEKALRVHRDRRALGKLPVASAAAAASSADQLLVLAAVVVYQLGQRVAELY